MKSKKAKTVEEIALAERERERLKLELDEAKDQVNLRLFFIHRSDQLTSSLRGFSSNQNAFVLILTVCK